MEHVCVWLLYLKPETTQTLVSFLHLSQGEDSFSYLDRKKK